jgi:hypothetical protein
MTREEIVALVKAQAIPQPPLGAADSLKVQWLQVQLAAEIASQLADMNERLSQGGK